MKMSILQKSLAEFFDPTEARGAMDTIPRLPNRGRAFLSAFISAAFLWALTLSVLPQLHARVHPDANRAEHTCSATLIASGSYNHVAPAPLLSAPAPAIQFSTVATLTPQWVESPFLGACIFEHAPPAKLLTVG
jgi:hypothetical protein